MDARYRDLERRFAATGSPEDAGRLLYEAARAGRWLRSRDHGKTPWVDNTHRIGTLRFLAYLGWKHAVEILESLPLDQTSHGGAFYAHGGLISANAFSEIGPDVAKSIAPTVLSASTGAACVVVAHLLSETFDVDAALKAYEKAILAWRAYITGARAHKEPGEADREPYRRLVLALYEDEQRAMNALSNHERLLGHHGTDNRSTPPERARTAARRAWSDFLLAPRCHESDRAKHDATAIFNATYALAWECEPWTEAPAYYSDEWRALPAFHWARAERARSKWGDNYGARTSVGCMRVAKGKIKKAMLGPALVAAATLVSQ